MGEGVEWALHCVVVLGSLPFGSAMPAKSLAEVHDVSESYLLKHLKALAKAGVLESVPGPRGGYRLARPSSDISLLDVVEAVEGKGPAFRCTEIRGQGPCAAPPESCARKACAINVAMLRAEKVWRESLRAQSIADIVGNVARDVEPERYAQMGAWLRDRVR